MGSFFSIPSLAFTVYRLLLMAVTSVKRIEKMWCIYTEEYYSAIKRKTNAICSNMGEPRDSHIEQNKSYRDKYIILLICRILKKAINLPNQNRVTDQKTSLLLQGGMEEEVINWKIGVDTYARLYIKQMPNKDQLYSTGNSTPYSIMACVGKLHKNSGVRICKNDTLCSIPETNTTL